MATSESEDFESADEDFEPDNVESKLSDDNIENTDCQDQYDGAHQEKKLGNFTIPDNVPPEESNASDKSKSRKPDIDSSGEDIKNVSRITNAEESTDIQTEEIASAEENPVKESEDSQDLVVLKPENQNIDSDKDKCDTKKNRRHERQQNRKPKESKIGQSGSKKLGTRVAATVVVDEEEPDQQKSELISKTEKEEVSQPQQKGEAVLSSEPVDSCKDAPKEEFSSVFDKLASSTPNDTTTPTQSGGWGWGSWGSSLLSTATASVSTLTSHVSQGLSTVIDTVEGGLGAPDPEELARQDKEAEKIIADLKEPIPEEDLATATTDAAENVGDGAGMFPLGQIFSGVSQLGKIVENTGAKVLSGGLDTLEVIGKKTMAVLQEGDPGLKKKRALFKPDGPILSQALREAKDRAEEEAKLVEEKQAARNVHFETLFDDYQGLIHLEALEMLGRQCEMKLQSSLLGLAGSELIATQERLQTVRDECLLPDPDDMPDEPNTELEEKLTNAFSQLPVAVTADKLLKVWSEVQSGAIVKSDENEEGADTLGALHERAVAGLAQLTASCVEQFHRAGELLLVHEKRNPQQEASHLVQITLLESSMIEQLASSYCEALNTFGEPAQSIITKVFLEASNSSTYVQDAFQLLVPVLQIAVV